LDATVFLVLPAVLIVGKMHYNHSLGELMSMAYAFSRLYGPIKKLAKVFNSIRTLQGATKRVFAIMDTPADIQDQQNAKILPRHKRSIEFKGVNFGYSPKELILKDISFSVKAGEMVAFVGSTGAGKSTLMDLVPRFYDVTGGSIAVDGMDIREVTLGSLRRQIGIVSQKTLLFHTSISDNIGYGIGEKNMEQIESAAKGANAHDFILAQPNGYQTVIGDQGTLLSGGQRQRIAIARAIMIDPAILILDEAASALDAESEKLVQESIENLQGSRTILVVAHRLSTILKADHIHVLESGKIIESGTLKELLDLNGRFRNLYDMQFKTEERL
jgi:subfamily B ATP-binding cassette protein MsbA